MRLLPNTACNNMNTVCRRDTNDVTLRSETMAHGKKVDRGRSGSLSFTETGVVSSERSVGVNELFGVAQITAICRGNVRCSSMQTVDRAGGPTPPAHGSHEVRSANVLRPALSNAMPNPEYHT
jgi:hypothetical protein